MNSLSYGHGDSARYGECLSSGDHTNVRGFVHELVAKRLLPHLNEALRSLNEWVMKILLRRDACSSGFHKGLLIRGSVGGLGV